MPEAKFESIFVTTKDGLRLHARDYRGEADWSALPVICLPGLTRHSGEFHLLATALLDREAACRIVAVDYRGRGLSDPDPDPTHYTLPVESQDLLALMAALKIPRAIFIGISRGGLIAMGLGAALPSVVGGIVLNDVGPVVEKAGLLRIKGYVGRSGAMPADLAAGAAGLRHLFGADFPLASEADWLEWAGWVWTGEPGSLRLSYDPALARTTDSVNETDPIPDLWAVWDKLAAIPCLAVRGENSDILSAETLAEMSRRHPDLETVTVPAEGHTPFLHRPALANRIATFVRAVKA